MIKNPILHHKSIGMGPPIVLLHGLLASYNNLGHLSQYLAEFSCVHMLDLRNHGQSFHADSMSYAEMAQDVSRYLESKKIDTAHIVGHSMGGKVAMSIALLFPHQVKTVTVLDIAAVDYRHDPHHDSHHLILKGLQALSQTHIYNKKEAEKLLSQYVEKPLMIGFLLKNLKKDNEEWTLQINIEGIIKNYNSISGQPDGPIPYEGPILFLKGEHSNYLLQQHAQKKLEKFPNAQLKIIRGTGHELHVEKPRAISRLIHRFIST